jgi:hypothetical protein
MLTIHFPYYNLCLVHQTIGVTPATEAGVAGHAWPIEEIVKQLDGRSILDEIFQSASKTEE